MSNNELSIGRISAIKNGSENIDYTIMHENIEVLIINIASNKFEVYREKYLPFALRNKEINASRILKWIYDRVAISDRQYMSKVYKVRNIHRDKDKVIRDSYGASFIDNFWIKAGDSTANWDELLKIRDINTELNKLAFTGVEDASDIVQEQLLFLLLKDSLQKQ